MVYPSQNSPVTFPTTWLQQSPPRDSSPRCSSVFLANWFDQLGLMRGLPQFQLHGKKSRAAMPTSAYFVE